MSARNIEFAANQLQAFSIRSKLYAYFFLATSALMLVVSAFVDSGQSLSSLLAGACMLLIPSVIYFTSVMLGKVTQKILKSRVSSSPEFNTSFTGPFTGISWWIFLLTFGLASAEVMFDYFMDRSFGVYSIFLVTFTVLWLARFYSLFTDLKESVQGFQQQLCTVDATCLPEGERVLVEEAQRGNTETVVDKRDVLNTL
jgi:ABC-type multidrug transport system fused ATPase/permease subunit